MRKFSSFLLFSVCWITFGHHCEASLQQQEPNIVQEQQQLGSEQQQFQSRELHRLEQTQRKFEQPACIKIICSEDQGRMKLFRGEDSNSLIFCSADTGLLKEILDALFMEKDLKEAFQILENYLKMTLLDENKLWQQKEKALATMRDLINGIGSFANSMQEGDTRIKTKNTFITIQFPRQIEESLKSLASDRQTSIEEIPSPIQADIQTSISQGILFDCQIKFKMEFKNFMERVVSLIPKIASITSRFQQWLTQRYAEEDNKLLKCIDPNAESCTIYDNITEISSDAFAHCPQLKGIVIPNSVRVIGDRAFAHCPALTKIDIPEKVESMGEAIFANSGLQELNFQNPFTVIPARICQNCRNLTQLTFASQDNIEAIQDSAFENCISLNAIEFINATKIGQSAFTGCSQLRTIKLSPELSEVGLSAFAKTAIQTMDLGQLQILPNQLFYQCSNLSEITIPDTVTTLGNRVFAGTKLKVIDLNKVTTMGTSVFSECSVLRTVIAPKIHLIPDRTFLGCFNLNAVVHLPEQQDLGVLLFVSHVGKDSFNGCSSLRKVSFVEAKCIDDRAFAHCDHLQSIDVPGTLVIGHETFHGCGDLHAVTKADDVRYIGEKSFYKCSSLKKIPLPKLIYIKPFAFSESGLQSFAVSAPCKTIPVGMFASCPDLKDILFEDSDQPIRIQDLAFRECQNLRALDYKQSMLQTDDSSLTAIPESQIDIPPRVSSIGHHAFEGCTFTTAHLQNSTCYEVDSFDTEITISGGTRIEPTKHAPQQLNKKHLDDESKDEIERMRVIAMDRAQGLRCPQ